MKRWNIKGNRLEDLIHEGTCVFIYRARQTSLNRHVAIYTLSPACRRDPTFQNDIKRGAEILSSYEHPGIVPAYDFGYYLGVPHMVTKYMSRGFLSDYMEEKGQLSPRRNAEINKQVGSALDHLHAQGEVQGDPCTDNIAMDAWGNAYISDFIKRATDEVENSRLLGMPRYIAPERWSGDPSTPATDQFALGVIAYELNTGTFPFGNAINARRLPPTFPRLYRPNLSPKNRKCSDEGA